jgi:hypothetical protein
MSRNNNSSAHLRAFTFVWLAVISLLLAVGWALQTVDEHDETHQQTEAVDALCRSHLLRYVERIIVLQDDHENARLERYYTDVYLPELERQMKRLDCDGLLLTPDVIRRRYR